MGVTIKNDLTWDTHTRNVLNNLKYYFRGFNRSCRLLTEDSRELLYNAVIASRLSYCDCVWDKCSIDLSKKLQTIQNRSARRILNQMPGVSAAPLMKRLGWMDLASKRKLHKLVLLHRLLLDKGPKGLRSKLSHYRRVAPISTRGAINDNLYIAGFKTDYIKKSFFHDTVKHWNSLPNGLRRIDNNRKFKEKLQAYFLAGTQQTTISDDEC